MAENRWAYTVCLHAVEGDTFISTFFTCSKGFTFKFHPKQSSGGIVIVIVIPCGQTDRRTDGKTSTNGKLISGFLECAYVPKFDYV